MTPDFTVFDKANRLFVTTEKDVIVGKFVIAVSYVCANTPLVNSATGVMVQENMRAQQTV